MIAAERRPTQAEEIVLVQTKFHELKDLGLTRQHMFRRLYEETSASIEVVCEAMRLHSEYGGLSFEKQLSIDWIVTHLQNIHDELKVGTFASDIEELIFSDNPSPELRARIIATAKPLECSDNLALYILTYLFDE